MKLLQLPGPTTVQTRLSGKLLGDFNTTTGGASKIFNIFTKLRRLTQHNKGQRWQDQAGVWLIENSS